MKNIIFRFMPALLTGVTAVLSCTAFARQNAIVESDSGVNLAVVAEASTSRVSGDTSLASLNDGHAPDNSHVRGRGSYGNWPAKGTQWVQYDWSRPISTKKIDVYWWDDRRGVHLPKACRLLYWDGKTFVPVKNPSGLGVAVSQYNATTFDEVRTSKLRLDIDSDGNYSTGILEWKVYNSGKSPDFPPSVEGDVDRVDRSAIVWEVLTADANELCVCGRDQVLLYNSVDFSSVIVDFGAGRSPFGLAVSLMASTACERARSHRRM